MKPSKAKRPSLFRELLWQWLECTKKDFHGPWFCFGMLAGAAAITVTLFPYEQSMDVWLSLLYVGSIFAMIGAVMGVLLTVFVGILIWIMDAIYTKTMTRNERRRDHARRTVDS